MCGFANEPHLLRIINRIVATVGRRVDESQPMADARLLDGSRVNVAIAPIAVDGPLGFHPEVFQKTADAGQAGRVSGDPGCCRSVFMGGVQG